MPVIPEIKDFKDDAESRSSYPFIIGTIKNVIINVYFKLYDKCKHRFGQIREGRSQLTIPKMKVIIVKMKVRGSFWKN